MFGPGGSPWTSAGFSINLPQRINVSPLLTSILMNGFRLIQELKALDLPPTKGRNQLHLMVLVAMFDQLLFHWTVQIISVSAPCTFIRSQTRKLWIFIHQPTKKLIQIKLNVNMIFTVTNSEILKHFWYFELFLLQTIPSLQNSSFLNVRQIQSE